MKAAITSMGSPEKLCTGIASTKSGSAEESRQFEQARIMGCNSVWALHFDPYLKEEEPVSADQEEGSEQPTHSTVSRRPEEALEKLQMARVGLTGTSHGRS